MTGNETLVLKAIAKLGGYSNYNEIHAETKMEFSVLDEALIGLARSEYIKDIIYIGNSKVPAIFRL